MQVRKFEARSMQEALDMIKKQLGPDAIILHAKDNRRKFGLVGQGSVEITAAVADEILHQKNFVESKMNERDRERFQTSSARQQKQTMEDFVRAKKEETVIERVLPTKRYIDIEEDASSADKSHLTRQQAMALEDEVFQLRKALTQIKKSNQELAQNHYPGIEYAVPVELSATYERLVQAGLSGEFAGEILELMQKELTGPKMRSRSAVQDWLRNYIRSKVEIAAQNRIQKFHFFFGDAGAGKTSALMKLASHFSVGLKKNILLASVGDFRLGADLQLKYFSQMLGASYVHVRTTDDWQTIQDAQGDCDHVLVEFSTAEETSDVEMHELKHLIQSCPLHACHHFVCSANDRGEALQKNYERFFRMRIDDVIFSRFGDVVGNAFQLLNKNHLPLFFTYNNVRSLSGFQWAESETFRGVIR